MRAPTLLVAGELDVICGPAQAYPISEGVSQATLAIIPDCGHMPAIEASDRLRAEVMSWLGAP